MSSETKDVVKVNDDDIAMIKDMRLNAQLEELRRERDAALSQVGRMAKELKGAQVEAVNFRRKVIDVAMSYAHANEWCNEVTEALRDLGLADESVKLTYHVSFTMSLDIPVTDLDFGDSPDLGLDESDLLERIQKTDIGFADNLEIQLATEQS